MTPFGIRKMVNWLKYNYGDIPIYITENGISDRNGSLHDDHRIHYYRLYISELLKGEHGELINLFYAGMLHFDQMWVTLGPVGTNLGLF